MYRRLGILTTPVALLVACGGMKGGDAVRLEDPTAKGALGEKASACGASDGDAEAYVVDPGREQPPRSRDRDAHGAGAGARYTCEEFRLVKGCSVRGDYSDVGSAELSDTYASGLVGPPEAEHARAGYARACARDPNDGACVKMKK